MKSRLSGPLTVLTVLALMVPLLGAPLPAYGDGASLEFVSQISGSANDVAIQGAYAYVVSEWHGGRVFDITDPYSPVQVGSWSTGMPTGVRVAGDYAYFTDVIGPTAGLTVVDVSDPYNPTERGTCATPYHAVDVAVAGSFAYVADFPEWVDDHYEGGGLWVIDISDPDNPTDIGFYDSPGLPGWAHAVVVDGQYVYLADGESGLRVVDVGVPSNPAEVGSLDTPGQANGVALGGGYAYVADLGGGVRVVDVSDPENPSEVGSYAVPGSAHSVTVAGQYAYVTDDAIYMGGGVYASLGVWLLDISDPTDPQLMASYDTPGWSYVTTVAGDYIYVAEGDEEGVLILRLVEDLARIDIMPGNVQNPINYKSAGKVLVAILSAPGFDATSEVDRASLTFGRTGDEDSLAFCQQAGEDVNYDGLDDLVCRFEKQAAGFQCGDEIGILKGTAGGASMEASDSVRIVPCKK